MAELAGSVSRFSDPIDGEFVLAFQESTIFGMIPQRFLDTVIGESLRCPAKVWRGAAEGMLASAPLNAAKQCAAPALLVRGRGRVRAACRSAEACRRVSAARVRSMPSVGHAPHWEAPEETAAMLAAFAAELDEPNSL
ncbi:MAG: alpha/beta hydrolase [Hyphomonadaceae bacterium]